MSDAAAAPWLKYRQPQNFDTPAPGSPWTKYQSGAPTSAPEPTNDPYGPPGEKKNATPSWLDSLLSGVSHGLGNVIHGGARIGARMGESTDMGFGPELPPGTTKRIDEIAAKREEAYQASPERKAHPYWAGGGEIAGESAGVLAESGPLALAAPARALPRWLMNLSLGTAGALATPKGGESMEPASQLMRGALGLAGAGIGTAVGEAVGKLISALVGRDEKTIAEATTKGYRTIIKPYRAGRSAAAQLDTQDRQILTATDQIIQSRKASAAAAGQPAQYPKSLREFVDALDENKRAVFQQYDTMAQEAGAARAAQPNPHLVGAFQRSGQAAQQAQNAVSEASQAVTTSAAATSRAGDNVYSNAIAMPAFQQAQRRLAQARAVAQRARQAHEWVKAQLYKPYIDLAPIANRLSAMTREARFSDLTPQVAGQVNALAERLRQRGFYGLVEAQDILQSLNGKLRAFYRNPTPSEASRAVADAELAGMLREQLDKTIAALTGPGYNALRKQYGALREIEKQTVAAYQREANKIPGGIGGIFADLWATEAGLKAVGTLDVHALGTAVAAKGAKAILQRLRDPNRAIARLFAARAYEPGRPQEIGGMIGRQLPRVAAPTGAQAARALTGPDRERRRARDTASGAP